jgi:hypothetical protein
MYAATVNGGIWKTTNATSASPTWTPLTDQAFPSSLSINSIAISPVDNNTIYAGTGSTSSDGFDGNPGFGVAKSTDGGATWTLLGGATFAGMRLPDIIPTSLGSPSGSVVMTANFYEGGGVYRSTDGGSSFTRISGAAGSGLPSAGVSSLVADPGNANRFYAAVSHASSATAHGIYKSTDGGQTWALVAHLPGTADNNSFRTLLAVHNSANGNVVWAMVIDSTTGSASGIFSSNNQGGAWVSLGVPSPILFPGGQGTLHGAISADPSNPNLVYVAGDRQDSPFPNANGCNNFSGNVYLGNSSTLSFTNLVCNGANGTSPHADSRWMAFDSNGNLLNADDGGLFRLSTPTSSTRAWSYVGGVSGSTMRPTEFDSISYDPLNNVFFGGAQDVGSSYQLAPGSFLWNTLEQGDGGYTDIDADQTAHPNTSLRYFCLHFHVRLLPGELQQHERPALVYRTRPKCHLGTLCGDDANHSMRQKPPVFQSIRVGQSYEDKNADRVRRHL